MTNHPQLSPASHGPFARTLIRLNGAVERVENFGAFLAGSSIFLVMAIVFFDVFFRYLFRMPFSWSYDLISIYLVPILFFLVVSETFKRNHHVAVDIFYLRFPPSLKRAARLLIAFLMSPIVWEMTKLSALDAVESYHKHEVISGVVLWPTWIPLTIVVLGFGLLLVRLVLDAVALGAAMALRSACVPGESPPRERATSHDEDIP